MLVDTDERRLIVDTVRDLAQAEFADRAFEWGGDPPWENLQTLAERGFVGINFDEEYGGGGLSEYEALLVIDAVGRVCPDTAFFLGGQCFLAPRAIHEFGTEAAKEKYLPPVLDGRDRIAIAISEPEAGSDVRAMNTTVREEGGELLIDGEKTWVSNAPHCSSAVVWTRFEDEGFGTVVVEFDQAGVEVQQHHENMAGHHQTQFYMEDVTVPPENVLTRGREGFQKNLTALNWERVGTAAICNALGRCALDKSLSYADQREQFGQPVGDFQGIEWKLADMSKELEASRALTYVATWRALETGGAPDPVLSSLAKLQASEMAESVTSEGLQIHGANGYQEGHPLAYLYQFARGFRIAGGTDEIIKNTAATHLKRDGVVEP